jgi:hypothetical protein
MFRLKSRDRSARGINMGLCVLRFVAFAFTSVELVRADAPTLQWKVETPAGRLTIHRTGSELQWEGLNLATVTWWDATGTEHAAVVSPESGWILRRQPLDDGCRVDGRQPQLGFALSLILSASGDVLKVRVPAASIAETGAAKLKTLRLLPRFGAAIEGDPGYLVTAQGVGTLCYFRAKQPAENLVPVYGDISNCVMPLFGIIRGMSGLVGIVTSGQFDAQLCISTNWGAQHQYSIDPVVSIRAIATEPRLADDLAVQYHFLSPAEANWVGVGKRYRKYNTDQRGVKSLRQRAVDSPELGYSAEAMEVRLRLGVKPVPYKIIEQTPETEPPVRVFLTFKRVRDIFDEFHRQGINQAEFVLVGWNRGGHDGRYPQIFPIEPTLGGEAELRKTITYGQSLGYQITAHTSFYNAYRIADNWSEAYLRKLPDGTFSKGGIWGGGQSYNICLSQASDLFAKKDLPRIRALGFKGLYLDELTIFVPHPCYDPHHPETCREDAEAAVRILTLAGKLFGGAQSNGSLDFAASACDRMMYICPGESALLKLPYVDACIPLYPVVYHGVLLYNLSYLSLNTLPGETEYLRNIEYGGLPLEYFYGHFLLDPTQNWLGNRDYRYDSRTGLEEAVAGLRRVFNDVQTLKHLQLEFMEAHRRLAEGVVETTYGDGEHVVVNYNGQSYALPCGGSVPPHGYRLLQP